MKKKRLRWAGVFLGICLIVGAACFCLYHAGLLRLPDPADYPIKGVDISSYQGSVDWTVLASQDIRFAYLKATEGSGYQDETFRENWENARKTDLAVGAYHFFSFDSPGETQAERFIAAVPVEADAMPPAVDVEFYADKEKSPPDKAAVQESLQALLSRLEEHYGKKPVLYSTQKAYQLYLSDAFAGYPIWIRDLLREPRLSDGRAWTFWQYTGWGRLDGYRGKEKFIDMNVFFGTEKEFSDFIAAAADNPGPDADSYE